MPVSQIKRTVTYTNQAGSKLFSLTDGGDGMVTVEWYDSDGNVVFNIPKLRRESFLEAFIALWPDEVAFQFESKEENG